MSRAPGRILTLYCQTCRSDRPFNRVRIHKNVQPETVTYERHDIVRRTSTNLTPGLSPDMRQVHATCMVCDRGGMFAVTLRLLEQSTYLKRAMCACGLPDGHGGQHLWELRANSDFSNDY